MQAPAVYWWCAARGGAWTWDWQFYPGVWFFVLVVATCIFRQGGSARITALVPGRLATIIGLVLLWFALDWPLGPLATGYLASAHTVQFILLALVVPPLLLAGVNHARVASWLTTRSAYGVATVFTNPIVTAAAFTAMMAATHSPNVVDGLMRFQFGAFALDVAWLIAGFFLWWPVVVAVPERKWFVAPLRMIYLFLGTKIHLLIAMWLLLAEFPVYATYELAPRALGIGAVEDQKWAGGLMIALAEPIMIAAITVLFFRWSATSDRPVTMEREMELSASPADQR